MRDVAIAVAAHKPYWMPADPMYVPVHAGAAVSAGPIPGYLRDDEPDGGISALNPHLSELTVMHWAWRNVEAGAVGLAHYRRHFAGSGERGIMTAQEALSLLREAPVVVPRRRNYLIERVGDHYDHTFDPGQLDLLVRAVAELSPESAPALRRALGGTKAHMFNMAVMRADLFDGYCSWMFPIVARVEALADYSSLTPFEARMPGRLSEYLLDTWLATQGIPYVERAVRDMEPVNWGRKGGAFLAAKFLGRKYGRSF